MAIQNKNPPSWEIVLEQIGKIIFLLIFHIFTVFFTRVRRFFYWSRHVHEEHPMLRYPNQMKICLIEVKKHSISCYSSSLYFASRPWKPCAVWRGTAWDAYLLAFEDGIENVHYISKVEMTVRHFACLLYRDLEWTSFEDLSTRTSNVINGYL